ncbi:MAG: GNAT family N-acetyltransferase [Glaciecola sp.]|nr:GNAT family N-acetyltransferase [Glaciecola sp.]MDG1468759.1 GNAT family N-acetyltransferase [Glaciecola sp.]
MFILRQGQAQDAQGLSTLILATAPELLPVVFGDELGIKNYLAHALMLPNGQYSAARHQVLVTHNDMSKKEEVVGCITLWHDDLGADFVNQTISAMISVFSPEQVAQVAAINPALLAVFVPPQSNQLALGHISVAPEYQGLGLGKKLIAYGIKQAKLLGKQQVVIDVDSDNEQAVCFYESCDFMTSASSQLALTGQTFLRMVYQL